MKEKKTYQVRFRLTESQLNNLVNYITDHPTKFKNKSQFICASIKEKLCRKVGTNTKNKGKS